MPLKHKLSNSFEKSSVNSGGAFLLLSGCRCYKFIVVFCDRVVFFKTRLFAENFAHSLNNSFTQLLS